MHWQCTGHFILYNIFVDLVNMKKIILLIIFQSISFCQEFQVGDIVSDLEGILCGNGKGVWHYPNDIGKVLFISSFATW